MFNGKVRCVKGFEGLTTVGKIYTVVDGTITFDNGSKSGNKYESVKDMNRYMVSQFEEVKNNKPDTGFIERVLVSGNATIAFFSDKTKQVVKHTDDLPYDEEKAVAMAVAKRFIGGYEPIKNAVEMIEYADDKRNGLMFEEDSYELVMIANRGSAYSTYKDFFGENGFSYLEKYYVEASNGIIYGLNEGLEDFETVRVIATGYRNGNNRDTKILVVNRIGTNELYLIGEDGLEFL